MLLFGLDSVEQQKFTFGTRRPISVFILLCVNACSSPRRRKYSNVIQSWWKSSISALKCRRSIQIVIHSFWSSEKCKKNGQKEKNKTKRTSTLANNNFIKYIKLNENDKNNNENKEQQTCQAPNNNFLPWQFVRATCSCIQEQWVYN